MILEPELGGVSIVAVGSFNPAIFQPLWFSREGLFERQATDAAVIQIIMPDFAAFQIENLAFQVEQQRFAVQTTQAPWIKAADLFARVFGELLPHTPISAIGVNRHVHFRVESENVRNSIGRLLAPLEPWGAWGRAIGEKTGDLRSGSVNVVMQETWRTKGFHGHTQASVQPSRVIPSMNAIFMQVNWQASPAPAIDGPEPDLVQYVHNNFDTCIKQAEDIIDQIMSLKDRV